MTRRPFWAASGPAVDLKDMAEADFVVEAATENEPDQVPDFQGPGRHLQTGCDPVHQHLLHPHRAHRRPDRAPGQGDRHAFHEPGAGDEAGGGDPGLATSDETFQTTWDLSEKFGKTPAEANDYPGFIANRILLPMINEAVYCLYHGVGAREDIDTVMKLGMNHPMGPLALADLIGLDTCLAIMETLYTDSRIPSTAPVHCCENTWRPAGWAARPGAAFTSTRGCF
jgi:3-hydroxybutyryl-CoA dehydrogenase